MKKTIISIVIFIMAVILLCAIYFTLDIDTFISGTAFFEFITTLTAIFGVVSILMQNKENHDLQESQFIVNLNRDYLSNKDFQKLLDELENTKAGEDLTKENRDLISNYFDFFEPVYLLVKNKIVAFDAINDLFSYRFFAVVNNGEVQRQVILPHVEFYKNIIRLHYLWKAYKINHNEDIPLPNTDLALMPGYGDYVCDQEAAVKRCAVAIRVVVREVTYTDYAAMDNLYRTLLPGNKISQDIYKDFLSRLANESSNKIFVAQTEQNEVIGTVQCTKCDSMAFGGKPHMVVDYFVVDQKYRRQGVGTQLFEHIINYANECNVKSIILVSSKQRKVAHAFYKKMRFSDKVKGFRLDLR